MAPITPPISPLSQQDFLDLLKRLFPAGYLESLQQIGPGYELLQAYAKVFERISLAASHLANDTLISIAGVAVKATGEVELYRDSPNAFNTPIEGQEGSSASIIAGAPAGQMRVSGIANMSAASVGHFLVLTAANSLENNGAFEIASFVDAYTVDCINAAAVIPDTNNGFIVWEEVNRTVIVKAGTLVSTSPEHGGREFAIAEDVTFLPSDLGPFTVPIEAVSVGYEWNVPGEVTTADGTVLPGDIDTIFKLVEDPALGDPTIKVRQIQPTTNGADAALNALGGDRGILRSPGESNDAYRARIRILPDTISPMALYRAVRDAMRPVKGSFMFLETYDILYQTCYDAPNTTIPGSVFNPNLFVYDDPDIDGDPFRNRWMDINDYRGGVIAVVENLQPISDTSLVYDDTAADVAALVSSSTGGLRAVCAYDVPSTFGFGTIQGGYDGFDLGKRALYKGIYDTLQSIKPTGSSVAVELQGE